MDGECRMELKKPLLLDAPGVDVWVGEDVAVSTPLDGGISRDKDGCGNGIGCGEAQVNGLVRGGGDEDSESSESSGVRPGGRAGEDASGSSLSSVVSSVVDWLADESTGAADDVAADSGACKPSAERSRSPAW